MWKFKASKYKNTTPRIPKKEDTITDLPIGNLSVTNNAINSSSKYLSFLVDGDGNRLAVLPLNDRGRHGRGELNIICPHQEQVNDFTFLPYHPGKLVTCSRDDDIKIWDCEAFLGGQVKHCSEPVASLTMENGRFIEAMAAHHSADSILGVACDNGGLIANIETGQAIIELDNIFEDKSMALNWSEDGSLLSISGNKGKNVGIFDPRSGTAPVAYFGSHDGFGRESRLLWAEGKFISSGFTNKRVQEIIVYDQRSWAKSISKVPFAASTGILIPLYDEDTKLLALAGKGSSKLILTEILPRDPYVSGVTEEPLTEQTVGACFINKKCCNVMDGEVQRFHQLTKTSIQPIPLIVPRRSYRDFHFDLYPDTFGGVAGCGPAEWAEGSMKKPDLVSLAPEGSVVGQSSRNISPTSSCESAKVSPTSTGGNSPIQGKSAAAVGEEIHNEPSDKAPLVGRNVENEAIKNSILKAKSEAINSSITPTIMRIDFDYDTCKLVKVLYLDENGELIAL
uniref:Coronin-7 n=1 Tax=Rhabditophanes sp. KR3021 TaxID=114890 RepID=A0AC35TIB6_9BILA